MEYKECACCHRLLKTSCFSINKRNKDGLHSYCRECNKRKAKEYNQSRGNEYTKKYRKKQINSGYYRFGHGAYQNMKKSAQARSIVFSITEKELKNWWLSHDDVCYYCGITIDEYIAFRDFIINYNGKNNVILDIKKTVFNKDIYKKINTMTIDRVDSNGPYAVSNIVKSCWICNSLKSNSISKNEMLVKGKENAELIRKEMNDGH